MDRPFRWVHERPIDVGTFLTQNQRREEMKKKVLWLTVSCAMVLSLIPVTSAPAASPTKETMRNFQGKLVEKPTYGGTLNVIWIDLMKINYWDEAMGHASYCASAPPCGYGR